MTPTAIIAALLSLYPRSPAARCLDARRPAIDAARDLSHALRACGSTVGAIARFRGGSCRPGRHTAYVARVAALAARLSR